MLEFLFVGVIVSLLAVPIGGGLLWAWCRRQHHRSTPLADDCARCGYDLRYLSSGVCPGAA